MEGKKGAKPKKVGILFFLDAKRRNPVRRFCILTANKEIEHFSKDENDPAARVGAISGLDRCRVAVFENSEADFSVTTGDGQVFFLQAQGGDQDRRNWVLEILKQRSIRSIVELLHDEKLGAYAAYALANQCGGADELKLEIVQQGGLDPLLKFTRSSNDAALVGLIYYSLSKLSLMEQNREAVGAHLGMLTELLKGDVAEYKAHSLKTLVNLVYHPPSRATMLEMGMVKLMIRALETVHASVQPEASALLLNFVSLGDHQEKAQADVMSEIKALATWVEGWAGIKEKDDRLRIYSSALANVLKVLTICCANKRLEEGRKLIPSVCSVLPISKPECESAALAFLQMLLEHSATPGQAILDNVDRLVESLNSKDMGVLTQATVLLSKVLRDPSLQSRDALWAKINPVSVVERLSDEVASVRAAAAELFALLAAKPGAAVGLQRDATSFTKLGDALLKDASLSTKLTAPLASLSTVPEIKYALVTGSLRQGLLASMSTSREGAEVTQQVLEVFANCTSNAGARRALADPGVLCQLLEALKSPSAEVQTRVGSVLSNLSTNSLIRRELRDLLALGPIFGAIMATKNRHLRMELMGAVCNICFTGLALSDEYVSYLISVLSSKSIKLRVASVNVLRNASLNQENRRALIRLKGIPALLTFLPEAKPEVQAHILIIVAAAVETDAHAVDASMLDVILALSSQGGSSMDLRPVSRAAMRCLAAAASNANNAAHLVAGDRLELVFNACSESDYVTAEYASLLLKRIMVDGASDALVTPHHLNQILNLFRSRNPVVLRRAVEIVTGSLRASKLLSEDQRKLMAVLLDFPERLVREPVVDFVLTEKTPSSSSSSSIKVPASVLLGMLSRDSALASAVWEVSADMHSQNVSVVCPPFSLSFANQSQRKAFLANLSSPGRPRLELHGLTGWFDDVESVKPEVDATVSPKLEQLEALSEYFKVVSDLGRARSADMASIIDDAAIASLQGEWAAPSGASRKWGAHSPNLTVEGSGTTLRYAAVHDGGPSVATVDGATVPHLGEFAYFEVLITACGEGCGVAVGMASAFSESRFPGWAEGSSFGYHGDDGNFYFGGNHREFGPKFGLGDVVGCGVDEIKGDLFFTLNGKFLGVAASFVNSFTIRPCMGLVNSGQTVFTNFGQLPFLWDFTFVTAGNALPAPRTKPDGPLFYPPSSVQAKKIDPSNFAGGLWSAELRLLHSRICIVDPAVNAALRQTSDVFSEWKFETTHL